MSEKMNRRDFLQASTLLGVGGLVGTSALLSACGEGNKLTPLKQPGEFYVPELPDMAAIEGVLNYEKHDYIYFCARAEMDGRHNFARTLNEHNRNAQEYHRALDRMKIRK